MPMTRGAIAMFDALGFKGIWNRPEFRDDPDVVLRKLRLLQAKAKVLPSRFNRRVGDVRQIIASSGVTLLSDTIVMALGVKKISELELPPNTYFNTQDKIDTAGVGGVAMMVSEVLREATTSPPVFAYRGVIAFGEYAIDDNFIMGQAVDEAAELMDRAQGAFVWYAPSAFEVATSFKTLMPEGLLPVVPYKVPLKDGHHFATYVVAPFHDDHNRASVEQTSAQILESFTGGSFDVRLKRDATSVFLEKAKILWRKNLAGAPRK